MTTKDVAKLLRLSPQTVAKLEKAGEIGSVRFGGCLRFSEESVAAFIRKCSNETQA